MKDRENHDSLGFNSEVNAVRKAPRDDTTRLRMYEGEGLWVLRCRSDTPLDLSDEVRAEIRPMQLITGCGFQEFGKCRAVKRYGVDSSPDAGES